jgi:hypothetical protein
MKSLKYNYSNYDNLEEEIKYLKVARRIPKNIVSPRKARKSRLLSADKQIKDEEVDIIDYERSTSNSPSKNISNSPNKNNKNNNIIPWNIKRKSLEYNNNDYTGLDYQRYNNTIILDKDKKMKILHINKLNKQIKNIYITDEFSKLAKKYNIICITESDIKSMLSYKGSIDLSSILSANIYELYYSLIDIIKTNKLSYVQINPFKFKCSKHGYNFDIEILKLEINNTYFIKFKSRAGDITGYRRLTQILLNQLNIFLNM